MKVGSTYHTPVPVPPEFLESPFSLSLMYVYDFPDVSTSHCPLFAGYLKSCSSNASVLQMNEYVAKQRSVYWHLPPTNEMRVQMTFRWDSASAFLVRGENGLEGINGKKELSIWLSSDLSCVKHEKLAHKAFVVLRMFRRAFPRITRTDYQILNGVYVRLLLLYLLRYKKDVSLIECVHQAASKTVASLKSRGYEAHLCLKLRGDLIFTYARFEQGLANGSFTTDPANPRRGHDKIFKPRGFTFMEQNYISFRVVAACYTLFSLVPFRTKPTRETWAKASILVSIRESVNPPTDGHAENFKSNAIPFCRLCLSNERQGQTDRKNVGGLDPVHQSVKILSRCNKMLRNDEEVQLHSVRTGHVNYSESTESVKPLTEEERKLQMEKLQELLQQKKLQREAKEREEELEREKQRRRQGKDIVSAKAKFEEDEMKRLVEQRRREKEEDRAYRERLKADIAREREEKKMRERGEAAAAPYSKPTLPPQATKSDATPLKYDFGAKEPLSAVRLYVCQHWPNGSDGLDPATVILFTTFPKRDYTEDDMQTALSDLGLCPSAVLMARRKVC
ncbi:hypothetical protein T265_01339 [Opisthorchis viverrini]|uniref:UBX domain-containing protein n=1 Tax=Opisthorchis viverrini TaxID=6198 RepID=A0A075AJ27_OPIVI|nr:hypothetical protein T265_01339 [Opisthorchis viverrini]KER32654.1 hypothetical protein T265_01339 [Opisthorchis viverrini]